MRCKCPYSCDIQVPPHQLPSQSVSHKDLLTWYSVLTKAFDPLNDESVLGTYINNTRRAVKHLVLLLRHLLSSLFIGDCSTLGHPASQPSATNFPSLGLIGHCHVKPIKINKNKPKNKSKQKLRRPSLSIVYARLASVNLPLLQPNKVVSSLSR